MKAKIFLLIGLGFLLTSCIQSRNAFIEFRHVGESNKYVTTVILVKKEVKNTIETTFVKVNNDEFNRIYLYLKSKGIEGLQEIRDARYGTFMIYQKGGRSDSMRYYLTPRRKSVDFFKELINFLNQNNINKEVKSAIEVWILDNIKSTPPNFQD